MAPSPRPSRSRHESDRQVGLSGGDVGLQEVVADVVAVVHGRERQGPLEVLGYHDRHLAGDRLPARLVEIGDKARETGDLRQLRLRLAALVGEAEVHLEGVVPVRVLSRQVVVVAVVPGEPARGSCEEARVQHLAVVVGCVLVGGEVRAQTEFLQHDGAVERAGELAGERGRHRLAYRVVRHRVDVWADEVHQRCESPERVAVVVAGDLDAPRALPE